MENENEAVAVTVPNQATELSYDYVLVDGGWKCYTKGIFFSENLSERRVEKLSSVYINFLE